MPCVKDCCRPACDELSFEIRHRNSVVIGNQNAPHNASHPRCLPGINPDRPLVYRNVSFGATREYGPEEGWQAVVHRKKKRASH